MEKLNLEQLWKECAQQNRRAQEQFYSFFSKRMFAICKRYASTTLEAEDILQNGFIKIFTKHHLYDGIGSLEGWMKKIIVNVAIETIRKKHDKFTDTIEELENTYYANYTVTDQTGYKDLLALIQTLPLGYKTVFNLYVIEGYSHKEIAQLLQISEGNSKSQLSRARQWLQTRLVKLENEQDGR